MTLRKVFSLAVILLLFATNANANHIDKSGYITQTDNYSCSPISMINAMIALGYTVNVDKWLPHLQKTCKVKQNQGTKTLQSFQGLLEITRHTKVGFQILDKKFYNADDLKSFMKADTVLILSGWWEDEHKKRWVYHAFVLESIDKNNFALLNAYVGNSRSVVKRERMDKWMKHGVSVKVLTRNK